MVTQLRQTNLQAGFHRGRISAYEQVPMERGTARDEGPRPDSVTHAFRIRLEQHRDALLGQRLHHAHHVGQSSILTRSNRHVTLHGPSDQDLTP